MLFLSVGYVLGLAWGQVRLPFAAIKGLADYDLLRDKSLVSASDAQLQVSAMQRWYLKRAMKLVEGTGPPRISAEVRWNCGVVARVRSGLYTSPMGAESLDGLYVCVFGAWFQVYGFSHAMAQRLEHESAGIQLGGDESPPCLAARLWAAASRVPNGTLRLDKLGEGWWRWGW